ncbi:MAG: hypothetical protein IIW48_11180 [Clostridia bacterium]|nr:hypothetical protein [Clostridia bacterium]
MKNKLLLALPAVAVLLVFLLFFKGGDRLTLPQRIAVNGYLSANPFFGEESGDLLHFVDVAAGNDSEATEKNTFLWFLNRCDGDATYVELDIAFDSDNRPCLADSYDTVGENPVLFERVLGHIGGLDYKEVRLVLNLREYTNLESLNAAICQNNMQRRTLITGVNEISLPAVVKCFNNVNILCDYDSHTKSSLEQLKELGARGIICSADKLTKSLADEAKELEMLIWVRCDNEVYGTLKAMNYCVDGVVSSVPEFACMVRDSWGDLLIDDIRGVKGYYDLK